MSCIVRHMFSEHGSARARAALRIATDLHAAAVGLGDAPSEGDAATLDADEHQPGRAGLAGVRRGGP